LTYNSVVGIKGKVAIVTGASEGIGEAVARELAKQGAKVVLAARNKYKLEKLAKELPESLVVVTDMTREDDIKKLIDQSLKHYGRIDILVNNAGQGYDSSVEKIKPEVFRELFELDVIGPVVAMQQVIPIMRKAGGGYIVNVSSGTALMYLPNMAAYSGLKRALGGISLTAREELKDDNIGVSVVYPYVTSTDFEKNTISEVRRRWNGEGLPHPADSPEYIAKKIVEGIKKEEPEIFAHEWMKNPKPGSER
jgi:short-subunit dehydrogenase